MSTWDAPERRLTIWGGSQRLASLFGLFLGANATAVFWVPGVLGYPHGGAFLLEVLPLLSAASWLLALLAIPVVIAGRIRIGLGACVAFVGALALLGAVDAYFWALCVASV